MQDFNPNDLTKPLIEPDSEFGSFEPDPNDPFIQRYVPSDSELERINSWLKRELDAAWDDDQAEKTRKRDLLDDYRGVARGKEQILTMPLIKRAVRRNVSYTKGKILSETPIITVKPTSNQSIQVLVEDPTYGTVPMEKSSEEVANSFEWWLDWKLRNRVDFAKVVEVAATEAKRGQTPTWIKVVHKKEKRTIKAPRYEKKGPIAVTFNSKDDIEVVAGDPDQMVNVSTYSMLMPADEQDPQESRWLAESIPMSSEEFRRCLYNGDHFLADKADYEDLIALGIDEPSEPAKADKRVATSPKGKHDRWEVWFNWTVPMKQTIETVDDNGEPRSKTLTTNQEYEMVGHFHRKLGKLLSLARNPNDHGLRPYVPIFDRKEPFRHSGESLAEDVAPYQRAQSQLISLEIKGGVIATTPIFFAEPGSVAGDWIVEHDVNPGDVVPRLRPDEVEKSTLGDPSRQSLIGLIGFLNGEYEKNTSIGDLQLGLNVPSRTPASSVSQILNEGQTDAQDFLERFCGDLIEAVVLYVKTVQQYMRTGEVIPFDPETKAAVTAALEGGDPGQGVPVRFPMAPITDQFIFSMTAISGETQQADFEKFVAFKQIVDQDGMQLAQIIGPLASGQLMMHPSIEEALIQQITRSQKLMERIGKTVFKDGKSYAISQQVIQGIAQEGQMLAQMQQLQQEGGPNGPQGTGGAGEPAGVPNDGSGLGANVSQPGGAPVDQQGQASAGVAPVGFPG